MSAKTLAREMRLRRRVVLVAALLAAGRAALGAAGSVPGEPGEPEIVLPPVILEVEDLSVERVEAKLPPEEELLPPAREVPLVEVGDFVIADPSVPAGAVSGSTVAGSRDRFLTTEVELGAGSLNHVLGSVELKTLGGVPRFSLSFGHQTMDGSAVDALAPGFGRRTDDLSGTLTFASQTLEATLAGSFSEDGTGLQGLSPGQFLNRLNRSLGGRASFSARPVESLTLGAGFDAAMDSLRLEGTSVVRQESQYTLVPSLSLAAQFTAVRIGLDARYGYRSSTPEGGSQVHNFDAGLSLEWQLTAALLLAGSVGWYGSSAGASLVPFEVRLSVTPASFVALSAGGGYRVTPLAMRDVLALHPLVLPDVPEDDSGWFADGALRLTFTKDVSASARAAFSTASAALDADASPDPVTGLYPLAQREGSRLTTDLGMRWGITSEVSVSASLAHEWLALTHLVPADRLLVELAALQSAGRWGGNLSVDVSVPQPAAGSTQLPVVTASGFFAVSDIVTLQLGAADLLGFLLPGGARLGFGGYEQPGFRVTASVRMSF